MDPRLESRTRIESALTHQGSVTQPSPACHYPVAGFALSGDSARDIEVA